jgi:hypothetical protein
MAMKAWTLFNATWVLSGVLIGTEGCPPVRAEEMTGHSMPMEMGDAAASSTTTAAASGATVVGATGNQASSPADGQAAFATLKQLFGKWEAPLSGNKTIVDTFQPFAFGTAILAEEWVGDQQITSTVFYMVGSELRADHYCDYGNQPRYTAKPSADPSVVELEFRDATNLDTHPTHFHSTKWHLVDATHMTQDWDVEGSAKGKSLVHLEFVRRQ